MCTQAVQSILKILDDVEDLAKSTPPVENSASRFGNPAFRTFYDKVIQVCHRYRLGQIACSLSRHLRRSIRRFQVCRKTRSKRSPFTSRKLGETDNELTMAAAWSSIFSAGCSSHLLPLHFISLTKPSICLERLGALQESDHKALVLRVFWRYIQVMRVLQSTYWLEPAGSHGVWGLDDYHFLPFLLGSAQLKGAFLAQSSNSSV